MLMLGSFLPFTLTSKYIPFLYAIVHKMKQMIVLTKNPDNFVLIPWASFQAFGRCVSSAVLLANTLYCLWLAA